MVQLLSVTTLFTGYKVHCKLQLGSTDSHYFFQPAAMTISSSTSAGMGATIGKVPVMAVRHSLNSGMKGRMFSIQADLPNLPVPPLQQTLDKYLKTVKPITTEAEYNHTQQVCMRTVVCMHTAVCMHTVGDAQTLSSCMIQIKLNQRVNNKSWSNTMLGNTFTLHCLKIVPCAA